MEMLNDGKTPGWVMNEYMDAWVHLWIRGRLNGVEESIEKRLKVASYSSKPISYSNILV